MCDYRAVISLVPCSDDGVCPCQCNYAVDEGCTCRDLKGTVSVGVTKSPVLLMYPLTYMRNVNYYATEEVVYTYDCEDGALAEIPTCNWLSIDNEIQDDSQVWHIPNLSTLLLELPPLQHNLSTQSLTQL